MQTVTIERTNTHLVIKIPFKSAEARGSDFSVVNGLDAEIKEGLADIAAGRIFGPFKNVAHFKKSLKASSGK